MRTCPNCGHMLSEKDTICFKCGMQLSQIQKPNPGMMPPQQPMMNPNMKPQGKPGKPKLIQKVNPNGESDGKSIYIIAGVIVLLIAVAGVIIFMGKNSKAEGEPPSQEPDVVLKPEEQDPQKQVTPEQPSTPVEPEQPTQPEQPKEPSDPGYDPVDPDKGNNTTVQVGENEHLVKNNGYSYAVPNEYMEKDYGVKGFDLLNYKKTKEMIISVNIGTVAKLKNSLPALRQMYIDAGATINDVSIKNISGSEVICVELTKNNQNLIMGITDAAQGEIFVIAAYNVANNKFDYNILTEGVNIVRTAVKTAGGSVET